MTAIRTNLASMASTQYSNYNMNSFCLFNGIILGASESGLFNCGCCTELGTEELVDSYFVLSTNNLGIPKPKRARYLYISYEATEPIEVRFKIDQGSTWYGPYELPLTSGKGSQRQRITLPRTSPWVYITVKVSNTDNGYFAVDQMELFPSILHNRRV